MCGPTSSVVFTLIAFALWKPSESYCIAPQGTNLSYDGQQCVDINEYANNQLLHFRPNTVLYVMSGLHTLYSQLVIQNTSNISLVGFSEQILYTSAGYSPQNFVPLSRIQCKTSISALSAINVNGLTVGNVAFSNCGTFTVPVLSFVEVSDLVIQGILIEHAPGYGMQLLNAYWAEILNSSFVNISEAACESSNGSFVSVTDTFFFDVGSGVVTSHGAMDITSCVFVSCGCGINSTNADLSLKECTFSLCEVGLDARGTDPYELLTPLVQVNNCNFNRLKVGLTSNSAVLKITNCTVNNSITCIEALNETIIELDSAVFSYSRYGLVADNSKIIKLDLCNFSLVDWALTAKGSIFSISRSSFLYYISAWTLVDSIVTVADSTLSYGRESAVFATESLLVLTGHVDFLNGFSTGYGGALYLSESFIELHAPVVLSFINNTAVFGGGAVKVERQHSLSNCGFFKLVDPFGDLHNPFIRFQFKDNTAYEAGGDVYASLTCEYTFHDRSLVPNYDIRNRTNADILRALSSPSNVDISADPLVICVTFEDGSPTHCSTNQTQPQRVTLFPGQIRPLLIHTVDEYGGTPPSVVFFLDGGGIYYDTWRTGTNYTYPLGYQQYKNVTLMIAPQAFFVAGTAGVKSMYRISVVINPCPVGFTFDERRFSCVCNTFLSSFSNVTCEIKDVRVHKLRHSWLGFSSKGLLSYYGQCPHDFCRGIHWVNLSAPDEQCNNNHSGAICGGCQPGLSHVFGQPLCQTCSNMYLLLLIPFAIMGVALVALIFVLDLTVSNGTISGFVFYANIVKINDAVFQPMTESNVFLKILSIFISWLNLDFGIVTCFYDGMDIYGKMALQFVFPAYILLIVGLTILFGRYSRRVSRSLSGHNVVPVLATLVLMSYAKTFKTTVAILSYASLEVEGEGLEIVWMHDGNVRYAKGGHGPLMLFALAIVILFIVPYTLLLLSTPFLQTKSEWKAFRWVNKLKPFIDGYEGPYVSRQRFWTGLLLLARAVIFLVVIILQVAYPNASLAVVITICVGLLVYIARFSVYKKWQYTLLEMFLCADLTVLYLAALSLQSPEGTSSLRSLHIAYAILVGMAFVCFLALLSFQIYSLIAPKLRSKQKASQQPSEPSGEYFLLTEISKPARIAEVFVARDGSKYDASRFRESLIDAPKDT